jgi:hypothetical protein
MFAIVFESAEVEEVFEQTQTKYLALPLKFLL